MIDGNHFVELAGKLAAAAACDEVTCRTVISRAYYGTFHIVMTFLEELRIVIPKNANSHTIAQRYLINSGHLEAQQAGMMLASLHSDRIRADYRLDDTRFDVHFARMRVALAHDLRSALKSCDGEDVKAVIKQGIDEYLRMTKPA